MRSIAITGHRPKDLPRGYGYHDIRSALVNYRPDALRPRGDTAFITGGALGIDQLVATFAMDEGLPFEIILPFEPTVMGRFWTPEQRQHLALLLQEANRVELVGGQTYQAHLYQKRNERMVDRSDGVFAFWSGKPYGGTANCIRYALQVGKPVWNMLPRPGRYPNIGRPIYDMAAA